ncbi:hypothetical protein J5N97_027183 [Dioscorea zingiberensis]|uniref:Apple domain-containing protein n=1 Tax=Dioscorea zingiberensis TaxID=325984 RepID=A0A9D5H7G4_9LILI|nr:hypothetical protein J5N97_027183 [Dioscorea zingiberensis]
MGTFDPSGLNQFILMWNGSAPYWSSGVWNGHTYSDIPGMDQNSAFVINFTDNNEMKKCTLTFSIKDAYTRTVLDSSGQAQQWLWINRTQEWVLIWSQPPDPCDVYSVCGAFGICERNNETLCSCLPGFEPVSIREWNLNDWSSGCKRKTRSQCREDNNSATREKEGFLAMPFKRLPAGSQPLAVHNTEECKLACLSSCSCTAYYYGNGCMVWNGDVRNLQQNTEIRLFLVTPSLEVRHKSQKDGA